MKKGFLLIIVLLQINLHAGAQDSVRIKSIIYKAKAYGVTSRNGYLSAFSDSSLFVSSEVVSFSPFLPEKSLGERLDFQNLTEVRIKRKGSFVRGLLIGALSGGVTGAVVGLASGSDYKNTTGGWCILCMTAGQKAVAGGALLGTVGGLTGGIVGAASWKKFVIGGKKDRFDAMRNRIRLKSFKHNKI